MSERVLHSRASTDPAGQTSVIRWRRSVPWLALALLLALVIAGCAGHTPRSARDGAGSVSVSSAARPGTAQALPQPSQRCGSPETPAETLRFAASDGVQLDGALVGRGPVGVVLLHEYPGPMCGWWPYASYLARHGVHVLLFDFRCLGLSACPKEAAADPVADVAGAANVLRARGARSIALLGASYGGVVTIIAAAKLHPSAVIDLSGERDLTGLVPGARLDSYAAAPRLRAPALFVVARDDQYVSVSDMQSIYRRARSGIKRLIVLPAEAGHGWNMLTSAGSAWSPLARQVLAFIEAHSLPLVVARRN